MYATHILESCVPWNYGFKGLAHDGDIMCDYAKGDCSSIITLKACAVPNNIYHMWRTIMPILKVRFAFVFLVEYCNTSSFFII